VQASVRLDHQLLALESEHDVHAMLELTVPAPVESAARPPLRLALVLDRSGSMEGRKLEIAKRCAAWLVARLRSNDELALVSFDDRVRLLAPLQPVEEGALSGALTSLRPGGSTNLSGGWLRGLEQLRPAAADGPRKILLLTDGLANQGITDPAALVSLAHGAGAEGVGTTTIGFGSDFDEELLTAMADAGGGNAHYAATPDAAPAIFADELEGLTNLVAQNVTVEIRPLAGVEFLGVLNEYPSVAVPGGIQLELGDAYGGERRRIVFALHLPRLATLGEIRVADLVLRYVSVGEDVRLHERTIPIAANLGSAAEAAGAKPDLEVTEEVLILRAAKARDEAIRLADAGEHEAAQDLFERTAAELRKHGGPALAREAEALDAEAPLAAPAQYTPANRKHLHYASNQRRRGRRRP